jgi:hypothetical protein
MKRIANYGIKANRKNAELLKRNSEKIIFNIKVINEIRGNLLITTLCRLKYSPVNTLHGEGHNFIAYPTPRRL